MTSQRFRQIAADLRERIALGEFGASGALDSEAALALGYAVSRPTIRKALDALRAQGLVEPRHGAGWYVASAAFHQPLALGTFRHASSAVAAAGKSTVREIAEFGYRRAEDSLAARLEISPGAELLYVRSRRTVDGDSLDAVREWVPPPWAGAISRDDATDPGIWATLARHGQVIATVRQTVTAGAATSTDAELLGVDVGTPLLLVRRLALGADGRPLALADHRYLAHRFALEIEFNSAPGSVADEPPGLHPLPSPTASDPRTPTTSQTGDTTA